MITSQQLLTALDAFKDRSNYLLVTTVAALGWASTQVTSTAGVRVAVIGSLNGQSCLPSLRLGSCPSSPRTSRIKANRFTKCRGDIAPSGCGGR